MWSITHYSCLAFVLPIWSCIIWTARDQRHNALRSSPIPSCLWEHPACPKFLFKVKYLPRVILPTIRSHQVWLKTVLTAKHASWHGGRNSIFSHYLVRWTSLWEKTKTVFLFLCCIVLSLNLQHPAPCLEWYEGETKITWQRHQWNTHQTMHICFQPLKAGHIQSPILVVVKAWELVPDLPLYHSTRIWLVREPGVVNGQS